jgi:hypothetical protein
MPTNVITIDTRELERLQSCEAAWSRCFMALLACNDQAFQRPLTGTDCAIEEIYRLQILAGVRSADTLPRNVARNMTEWVRLGKEAADRKKAV